MGRNWKDKREGEAIIRIYCKRRKSIFNKKKNEIYIIKHIFFFAEKLLALQMIFKIGFKYFNHVFFVTTCIYFYSVFPRNM